MSTGLFDPLSGVENIADACHRSIMPEFNDTSEDPFERRKRSRAEDARALAAGEVTAEELQRRNSIIPPDFWENAKIDWEQLAVGDSSSKGPSKCGKIRSMVSAAEKKGNYTEERDPTFGGRSVDEIVELIEKCRQTD